MATLNKKKISEKIYTHGNTIASKINPKQELERMVLASMLWEDLFYIDGVSSSEIISKLIKKNKPEDVAEIAIKARNEMKLRHMPLFLVRELMNHPIKCPELIVNTLVDAIQRPDELSEFMAIYWKDGKCPIAKSVKKGLAKAFTKFNEYQFGKYKGESKEISVRDVMFLCHPKPVNENQAEIFKKIADKTLETPDTWETNLSGGKDKKETFERLMQEKKLGGLAFIRNLRNILGSNVDLKLVKEYSQSVNVDKILPYRFFEAHKHVPSYSSILEEMMIRALQNHDKFIGKTVLIVDTSGSMGFTLSKKSNSTALNVACALASMVREISEDVRIYATAGSDYLKTHATTIIPDYRGFALSEKIANSRDKIGGGGIFLTQVMDYVYEEEKDADRVIVFTDEQDTSGDGRDYNPNKANAFGDRNYIINVAGNERGIAYNNFVHITGWSEKVIDFIQMLERSEQ